MTDETPIRVRIQDHVGWLAIDRPDRHNAMNRAVIDGVMDAIDRFENDNAVRAVVLHPGKARSFSAGADIEALFVGADASTGTVRSRLGQRMVGRVERSPLPVVAAIDGFCLGGGLELVAGADLRIATDQARFGLPELDLGIIPGWGGTQRLQRIIGEGRAKEMVLTGERYEPATLRDWGFLSEVVAEDTLIDRADELAAEVAAGPPKAMAAYKRTVLAGRDGARAGFEAEAEAFGRLIGTADAAEGLAAFQEDRDPSFDE